MADAAAPDGGAVFHHAACLRAGVRAAGGGCCCGRRPLRLALPAVVPMYVAHVRPFPALYPPLHSASRNSRQTMRPYIVNGKDQNTKSESMSAVHGELSDLDALGSILLRSRSSHAARRLHNRCNTHALGDVDPAVWPRGRLAPARPPWRRLPACSTASWSCARLSGQPRPPRRSSLRVQGSL